MQATLGVALAWTGRSQQGLALLDQAVEASRGDCRPRAHAARLGPEDLGRFHEAHQDLNRALPYSAGKATRYGRHDH